MNKYHAKYYMYNNYYHIFREDERKNPFNQFICSKKESKQVIKNIWQKLKHDVRMTIPRKKIAKKR